MCRMLAPVALAVLAAGCGNPPPPSLVEVKGKLVDAAGRGVPNMVVVLTPSGEENKGGPRLTRPTGKDGTFAGRCWPGPYQVAVSPLPAGPGGGPAEGQLAGAGGEAGPGKPSPATVTIPPEGGGRPDDSARRVSGHLPLHPGAGGRRLNFNDPAN